MPAVLAQNNYGKSLVRMLKATRLPDRHDIFEVCVATALEGDFADTHVTGDNAKVIPTDTQKNTVYALGRQHTFACVEEFGLILGRHFVNSFPALVTSARAELEQSLWHRVTTSKGPHPTTFESAGNERRTARVVVTKTGATVEGGIRDLLALKSTDSAFVGYLRDRYTTLKETDDRIFATSVAANWKYTGANVDFDRAYCAIRTAMMETFAFHKSLSVQQTLLAMGDAALAAAPEISEIRLSLPNKHYLLVNLEPFGLDNPNQIFVPTSEPHGLIEATITRG